MIVLGVSAGSHDASVSLIEDDTILFAAHSERYSRVKNDPSIHSQLIVEALKYGQPDLIAWYEKPWKKKLRYARAGQWDAFWNDPSPRDLLAGFGLDGVPLETFDHHRSHAAAGFYTSGLTDASVLVVDAIGEQVTTSIWRASESGLNCHYAISYPNSIGLFYSAFTQRCGLKPNEEEYIFMGMAAYGVPRYVDVILHEFFEDFNPPEFHLKTNLHRGCQWWRPQLENQSDYCDIAASVQAIVERYLTGTCAWIRRNLPSRNLVFMGGVALNCVANTKISQMADSFQHIWIMPNPGDAGSSLGAAALAVERPLKWTSPYLGTDIPGEYPVAQLLALLLRDSIVGVARGRAEFGPRALGNRSLLADPRDHKMKDRMNAIKHRQRFRPFAPVIMEEHAASYFDMPVPTTPYMQFVARCRNPLAAEAIVHVDNTSRVQTVNAQQHPGLYELLDRFFHETGCPMLLNTSLNIRGEPLVDTVEHARAFMNNYHVRVF